MKQTIRVTGWNRGEEFDVPAVVRGNWALHQPVNSSLKGFVMVFTYLPSGQGVEVDGIDSPVALAHALKRLATLPPAPLDKAELHARIRNKLAGHRLRPNPEYAYWIEQVRAIIEPLRVQ